ncbi:nuclear transport factor 2 family protein [Undibacterium arcticum]
MNAQENKQLVMQGYQMFQSGDIKGLLTLLSDDIEWMGPDSETIPFAGDYHGRDQVAQYFCEAGAGAGRHPVLPRWTSSPKMTRSWYAARRPGP